MKFFVLSIAFVIAVSAVPVDRSYDWVPGPECLSQPMRSSPVRTEPVSFRSKKHCIEGLSLLAQDRRPTSGNGSDARRR